MNLPFNLFLKFSKFCSSNKCMQCPSYLIITPLLHMHQSNFASHSAKHQSMQLSVDPPPTPTHTHTISTGLCNILCNIIVAFNN